MAIDSKDKKIINVLRDDARLPLKDIARITKIRPSTVHQRISKLVEHKVIEKFTIKLDNAAVGEDFIAFMQLTTSSDLPASFFADKHIKEAFGMTGEYDLLLKLKFANIQQFNDWVIALRKRKEITKTHTTVATVNLKEEL